MKTRTTAVLLGAFIALGGATGAGAQGVGGMIRKKVEEAKPGDPQPAAQQASIRGEDVLPITNTLLDGFERGLSTELRLRAEFQTLLGSYKTPEQYQTCSNGVAATPEAMKILESFAKLPDNATEADIQRAMEKMSKEMKALITAHCGKDVKEEWPDEKRKNRMEQIESDAAAAVDPAKTLDPFPDDVPFSAVAPETPEATGASISLRAYQILKERIVPFCDAYEKGRIKVNGQPVSLAGAVTNMHYVYTAAEAAYLAPRCKRIMTLLAQLL